MGSRREKTRYSTEITERGGRDKETKKNERKKVEEVIEATTLSKALKK